MTEKELMEQMAQDIRRLRRVRTGEAELWPIKMVLILAIPYLVYEAFQLAKRFLFGWLF